MKKRKFIGLGALLALLPARGLLRAEELPPVGKKISYCTMVKGCFPFVIQVSNTDTLDFIPHATVWVEYPENLLSGPLKFRDHLLAKVETDVMGCAVRHLLANGIATEKGSTFSGKCTLHVEAHGYKKHSEKISFEGNQQKELCSINVQMIPENRRAEEPRDGPDLPDVIF